MLSFGMIKDWILSALVRLILDQIKNGGIEKLADQVEKLVVPAIRNWKKDIFARLKTEAAATGTPLDDAIVEALDLFFEELIPDCSACKAVVSK